MGEDEAHHQGTRGLPCNIHSNGYLWISNSEVGNLSCFCRDNKYIIHNLQTMSCTCVAVKKACLPFQELLEHKLAIRKGQLQLHHVKPAF